MLIRARNIFEIEPPFLIVFGNGDWKVARRIFAHEDGIAFLEPFSSRTGEADLDGVLPGSPWHVGDNVWEMDYNAQIMTLDHPHYRTHPAWRLWLRWLADAESAKEQRRH
jgi:hypothetical protein